MSDPDNFVPSQPDEAHFQICQRAAEALGKILDGNGLKAEQVRLSRHETLVHQVPGYIHVDLKPEVTSRQLKGNSPTGKVLAGKGDVQAEAAGIVRDVANDKNVQEQLLMEIRKDEGKGFGMDPFKVALSALGWDFCVVETCLKCQGQQSVACARCNAQGVTPCATCQGQGYQQCQQCYGSGFYFRGGTERLPCTRCGSQGRMQCMTCQGQRQTRCMICQGQGRVGCTECAQSGYWTNLFHLTFNAEGSFVLDRQQVPPEVLAVIDTIGQRQIATQALAEVFRAGIQPKENAITFPLIAFLPIANAEFSIEGKPYPATVAGLPGRILAMQPVLDTTLKPGINALFKLSKGPMAAQALIETACRYRLIRQVIAGLAHHSKRHVYQQIVKDYPVGISEKYAKATIKYADAAVLAISRGPRMKGLLIGVAASTALSAGYFLGPLRAAVLAAMQQGGNERFMLGVDLAVCALGYIAALFTIKFVASGALKKLLPDNVQSQDRGLPSAGEQGWYALGVTLAVWLGLAFAGPAKPDWVLYLLKLAGHG